nr:serine/threonine-protein phosphatase 4 regulatory subunit 3B-like isoform X3 [Setaria viridis]
MFPKDCSIISCQLQHVKVYCLTDDGQCYDQGTGHVTIDYFEGSSKIALAVVDEEDDGTLLLHNISSDDIYRNEEETTISFKDPERALDLVLSFEDAEGCSYIWQRMLSIQKKLQSSVVGSQVIPCPKFEIPEASSSSHGLIDDSLVSVNDELPDLPPLELSSLPLILKIVLEWGMKNQTLAAELISQDDDFFPKLVDLFRMCEGSRNMDGLHMIFRLVKGIILLNNFEMFNNIFSDDFILDMIGALEYDPEVCHVHNHRASVQKQVVFKEAIPIKNAYVASKIHQTYRIRYIKDVILPKVLDEATAESIDSIIRGNNVLVVCVLRDDASFIQDLFAKMKSSNISAESKSKLVLFLHEFCTLSRSLHPDQQWHLSMDLVRKGVFDIIYDVLRSQNKVLVSAGMNVLKHFLDQDPNFLRTFIAHREENYQEGDSLLGVLVQGMVIGSGEELRCQSCLMTLLDPSAPKTARNCEVVIQAFFEKHLHILIDVIASSCPPKGIAGSASGSVGVDTMVEQHSAKPEILLNICELLCFCARHHYHRMKVNIFASNAMEKILTLTCQREAALVVAAVRFMRTVIGRKDEFLNSRIIKLNLLKPIIEAFVENGDRYNMLHSTFLDLLDFIRKENLEFLIEYVAESFWDQLVKFERLESIQAFKLKYQQIMESAKTKRSASVVDMRKKADERGADKEEENYFKDSDGEDSATAATGAQKQSMPARPKSGGHADCDDDNDDKNYDPPPRKPIKADEDDEALVKPVVRSSPDDGSHTSVKAHKKPKLRVRISFAKSVASASVTARHSGLEYEEEVARSPSTSTESSEDSDGLGGGSPGSQHQLQKGEDGNDTAEDSSPKMVLDTAKSTDSEPK